MSSLVQPELFSTGPDPYLLQEHVTFTVDNALTQGLAYDPTDGLFHIKTLPTGVIGDVLGPALSAADQVPTFADATGKVLQASNVTIDSGGNVVIPTGELTVTAGNINLPLTVSPTEGSIFMGGVRTYTNYGGNLGIGYNSSNFTQTGTLNCYVGSPSGFGAVGNATTTGSGNTVVGCGSCGALTTAIGNVVIGTSNCPALLSGSNNIILGTFMALNLVSGGSNILIGTSNVNTLVTGSSNIIIGQGCNVAVANNTSSITIGNGLTAISNKITIGNNSYNACAIRGISGTVTPGAAVAVLVDANGELGTVSSSRLYKDQIQPLSAEKSALLYDLNPVSFVYKKPQVNEDGSTVAQFGLIAEEVALVLPELVVYKDGKPDTVRYDALFAFLIAEIQHLRGLIDPSKK